MTLQRAPSPTALLVTDEQRREPRVLRAGTAQPLDADVAHGRLRRAQRDPDHGARRGHARLRRERHRVLRRPLGTLHEPARPRTSRHRGGGGRADGELGFFPLWTYAHPRAIELAEKLASLTPGDLNRVFFTSGGSEAERERVEARAPVPQDARRPRPLQGDQSRHRLPRHDDGGAHHHLARALPHAVRAARARCGQGPGRQLLPRRAHGDDFEAFGLWQAHQIEEAILREGPETVAAVFLEPVQNAGGCFTPPPGYWQRGARDLRPLRRAARLRRGHLRASAASARGSAARSTTTCPT